MRTATTLHSFSSFLRAKLSEPAHDHMFGCIFGAHGVVVASSMVFATGIVVRGV